MADFTDLIAGLTGHEASSLDISVESGSPYAEIIRKAEEMKADLIVIPSGDSSETGLTMLGGITEMVVRYAPCPVLVSRPNSGEKRILAATDFSDPSLPAIAMAAEEARRSNYTLTLLHSLDLTQAFEADLGGSQLNLRGLLAEYEIEEITEQASRRLHEVLRSLNSEGEIIVSQEPPSQAIINAAVKIKAELVVVGTSGKTGLIRWVLGSVAESVVRNSRCSTLVVRLHEYYKS